MRQQKPLAAEHYVKAIALVAGTYKRMSDRNIKDIDEVIQKAVRQQTAANAVEDDLTRTLNNSQLKKPQSRPGL